MIWYILSGFRGTTEPPQLGAGHPIRRAFHRYGAWTARHWLLSILLSVTVAVLLCYPVFFLYDTPTFGGGFARLPRHVWTAAMPVDGEHVRPDVEIRQVWVFGDKMKAVDRAVLSNALEIQNSLVDGGFRRSTQKTDTTEADEKSSLEQSMEDACFSFRQDDRSWGIHSPLFYWNCSGNTLETDNDIVATINRQSNRQTFLNFTLRPSFVFAGKSFHGKDLVAADALVITLFDRSGHGVGKEWDERIANLARRAQGRYRFYPEGGNITTSHLFKCTFEPMSVTDDIALAVAYLTMAFYVLASLRKLRAVKSQFGLIITVISQITISVLASITICGLLEINLTQIPQEAYPFVVLAIGLENMFRLINAVLSKPAEMPTTSRIANALGDVGHLSLAAAAQNLILLWLLSLIVWPGVAAFCAFAAVALIFDFVFHLTFFLAVLSVDVRRMELHESLEKVNSQEQTRARRLVRQTWIHALLRNELPSSTRWAGSAILICFTLALNWHFDPQQWTLIRFMGWMRKGSKRTYIAPPATPLINQARTPGEWLKMQDYETAREVVRFVKPNSYKFIARVYEPLWIVLQGANRGDSPDTQSLYRVIWRFVETHFFPFTLAVVFAIAVVTVLMNYLLWNELPPEEPEIETDLSIRHLPKSHSLDVVKLSGCPKGHMVSVGLDRVVTIWYCHPKTREYSHFSFQPMTKTPHLWPIVCAALDESGTWLALCTDEGKIAFWCLPDREIKCVTSVELNGQTPIAFGFIETQPEEYERPSLMLLTSSGTMTELDITRSEFPETHSLNHGIASCVCFLTEAKGHPMIISLSRYTGEVLVSSKTGGIWQTKAISTSQPYSLDDEFFRVRHIQSDPILGLLIVLRSHELDVVDCHTFKPIGTVKISQCKGSSLRVLHGQRRNCPVCNGRAVHSISFAYTDLETQSCVIRTFSASDEDHSALLCLRPACEGEEHGDCVRLSNARKSKFKVDRPGTWEVTSVQALIGLRKRQYMGLKPGKHSATSVSKHSTIHSNGTVTHRSTRALNKLQQPRKANVTEGDEWECWMLPVDGDFQSTPLRPATQGENRKSELDHLFVTSPGPMVRLGRRSVAAVLGNVVKVIMIGNEKFNDDIEDRHTTALDKRRISKPTKAKTEKGV